MPELETKLPDGTPLYAVVPAGEARDPAVREAAWARILEFFERKIP